MNLALGSIGRFVAFGGLAGLLCFVACGDDESTAAPPATTASSGGGGTGGGGGAGGMAGAGGMGGEGPCEPCSAYLSPPGIQFADLCGWQSGTMCNSASSCQLLNAVRTCACNPSNCGDMANSECSGADNLCSNDPPTPECMTCLMTNCMAPLTACQADTEGTRGI